MILAENPGRSNVDPLWIGPQHRDKEPSSSLIMTSSTALLFCAALLCFLVCSCVGTTPPAVARKPCEYNEIKRCNQQFKQVFLDAKNPGGRNIPIAWKRVYCRALQTFMNCLEQSLASCVGGDWLQNYSFVVLEHGVMDKKCGVCPRHDYSNLERVMHATNKSDYVGFDVCPSCAKGVHRRCVRRFLHKMAADSNICHDVQEFISCYKEEGNPKRSCATTKIIRNFSTLCTKLGEKMLQEDKTHPGLMC
ncbi:hypothetical protein OS493_020531 [Desmophyllum pertusum]|uniref:Uncharacterized protein n=1 Tax=Desmophyllum pertusum TaxID=174260 RepID=A0A9W9YZ02_9CNID|nr:hypothetical protein OS493_020531 [Desmophyllum pertusum]